MRKVSSVQTNFMKKFFFFCLAFFPSILCAQQFYFKCFYKQKSLPPQLYFVPGDNVFNMYDTIPSIKDSDSSFQIILNPSKIYFSKIGADVVMVKPGEHVEGVLNQHSRFFPSDSGSTNFELRKISDGFTAILINYSIGSSFKSFKAVFAALKNYVDSTDDVLNKQIKPWHDSRVELALEEYLQTRLAHYLVLPILFKSDSDEKELVSMIKQNLKFRFPEYWTELEPGRIFLHTYYRKIVLPNAKYDLTKSMSDRMYSIAGFRKLAAYDYFQECLDRGIVKTKAQLLADYKQTQAKLQLSKKEQEVMKEDVYKPIQKIGRDITGVFATLPLENAPGQLLTDSEKKALIAKGNIILDFWASWCVPCRARMEEIKSDKVTISGKQYHIIYLSIDANDQMWNSAPYPFLNKWNSFRITSPHNEFIKDFSIARIPRAILLADGALVSSEFIF